MAMISGTATKAAAGTRRARSPRRFGGAPSTIAASRSPGPPCSATAGLAAAAACHPVEPHRIPAHRLVITQRDPGVLRWIPLVDLPPGAGVAGGGQRIMRASSARMLRIVAGAGSRPVRRCAARWICWHQSRPAIPSRDAGARPGRSAMTSPSRRTSMLKAGVGIVPPAR